MGKDTMADEETEQQFTVDARPELSISNISGRIVIRAGDESVISMRATKHGSSRAMENTRIESRHEGNRVRIETKGERSGLLNLSRNVCSVDYDMVVPRDCELHVQAVSADLRVEGVSAAVHAQTVSGDVVLDTISGDCHITTVSGDASGRRLSGALSLRTTSGDAAILDSELHHFNLNSVSGDFSVETPLTTGQHYLAKTVSGDLQLFVPPDTRATVQMKTVSGDVTSQLQAEIIKAGRRHWQGRINGGGANVEMTSVSGDMRIAQRGLADSSPASRGGPEWPPAPPPGSTSLPEVPSGEPTDAAAPEKTDNTNEVLGALERGEITVEEAMARLEELR